MTDKNPTSMDQLNSFAAAIRSAIEAGDKLAEAKAREDACLAHAQAVACATATTPDAITSAAQQLDDSWIGTARRTAAVDKAAAEVGRMLRGVYGLSDSLLIAIGKPDRLAWDFSHESGRAAARAWLASKGL